MEDTKTCARCKLVLPRTSFPKDKSRNDGLFSYCKSCNYKHSRAWAITNKERTAAYNLEYRQKNQEQLLE
jgi:hypothetical protein